MQSYFYGPIKFQSFRCPNLFHNFPISRAFSLLLGAAFLLLACAEPESSLSSPVKPKTKHEALSDVEGARQAWQVAVDKGADAKIDFLKAMAIPKD